MTPRKRRQNGEGSLVKLKNCRYWYAQFYVNGKHHRVSTKTAVRAEALAVLRKLMHDAAEGLVSQNDMRRVKYSDLRQGLLDSYTNQGNKSLRMKADGEETVPGLAALDEYFSDASVTELTTDAARRFTKKRLDDGVGNAAINRSLAALRRMLTLAKREGKIRDVPYIEFLKEPPARKGFVTQESFERLLSLLSTHLRPLVTLLYYCGVRIGEALQIEWRQVDLKSGVIRLDGEQTKNAEPRVLPLPSELRMMLSGVRPKEGRVFDTNLRKDWAKACTTAGLGITIPVEGKPYDPKYEGLTLHDLRRSAVRNLVTVAGVPERIVMQISGHKTRAVFDRYHIVSEDDVVNAMKRFEAATLKDGMKTASLKDRDQKVLAVGKE